MKTVLIAEDEKMIRTGLATMVRRAPVRIDEVLEARDGKQALEILRSKPVDLLITDIRMPQMDGLELAAHCQKLEQPPFVLVISGYDDFSYAVEMLRNGVHDYLLKPVEREKFFASLEQIEQLLQKRALSAKGERERFLLSLRYIMLCENTEEEECKKLIAQNRSGFPAQSYRACCTRFAQALPQDAILIQDFDRRSLYLRFEKGGTSSELAFEGEVPAPVGISEPHTGLEQLRRAYQQALFAWKKSFFSGTVTLYQSPAAAPASEVKADQLVRLMGLSRWQEVLRLLEMQGAKVRQDQLSPDSFAQLCSEFVHQLYGTYQNLLQEEREDSCYANVWESENLKAYLETMENWLEPFSFRIQQEFADYENKQKIREAVQYIRENFCTPLNMAIVSNQVSMNYSLFSFLFKQYTGVNFVNYLQNLRIEESKRLLQETDWKVNEISFRCGFQDDKHFLKVFKASAGVSPTEWRRTNCHGGEKAPL